MTWRVNRMPKGWLPRSFGTWLLLMVLALWLTVSYRLGAPHPSDFLVAVPLAVIALIRGWRAARRAEAEKAEADRKEREERESQKKWELKRYEDPQRYVTDFCSECQMEIPAFARICPYCRSSLREER